MIYKKVVENALRCFNFSINIFISVVS